MKKNLLLITGAITLGAMLSGCSFVVPKKYKVVTKAEYNFTLAKMKNDLGSMMNFDEMFSADSGNSIKMYQYNPNGESNVKQLLMEMPVGDPVELDMGEYIQNDLYNGDPISVEQIIEMPVISVESGEIDLAEKISEELCGIIKLGGPIIAEASVTNAPASPEEDFSEFEFSAGSLNVYVKNATEASGVELYYNDVLVSSASFERKNSVTKGIKLSGMPLEVSVSTDWVAEIPLSGKTLHKDGMKIKFTGIPYAVAINPMTWSSDDIFIADLSSDAKISKAKGVTAKRDNIDIGEQTVPFSLDSVSDVTIGKGELKTELVKRRSSGEKCEINYSFNTSGALIITDARGDVDLHAKEISNQDLKITPTASLDFMGATLDLSELKFTYSCSIDEIALVTVNLTELAPDFDPHKDEGKPLTDDVTKMVKEIWFDESDFEITYTNTLPEGNDINLCLNSSFLNIENKNIKLEAGKTDEDASFKSPRDDVALDGKPTKIGEDNAAVDFTADIELPEYDSVNKTCVLKNVVPSKKDAEPQKYKLGVNVVPHIEWSEALVDLSDSEMDKSDEVDTPINFGSMMSALGDEFCRNVKIDSVPVYIYSEKPDMDAFKDVSIGGKITVIGAESVDLLKEGETLDLSKNRPDLMLDETGKIAQVDLSKIESACGGDIASTISFSSNEGLKIKYDIHITGISGEKNIRMKKSELNGQKTSLANYAYIVIPFVFNVSSDTDMAMPGIGGDDNGGEKNDLFGRSEAPTESSMLSFLDAVESFTIFMTSTKIPFYYDPLQNKGNKSVEFVMDLDSDGFDDPPLNIENGSYEMSGEDIKGAYAAYPYSPSVKIRFPSGKMSILSDMTLESRIDFQLKTDGTFTLNGSKKENK